MKGREHYSVGYKVAGSTAQDGFACTRAHIRDSGDVHLAFEGTRGGIGNPDALAVNCLISQI
ncbi:MULTISPECIES: hypothetical protein [unclassified Rhodococcus (in: high G+C Gram-positive bacteria)]|uniref:hypothetical protein n=1 Tax=unclassified Rhodococcus (in: high G+C Gram-positive bacteria) TaxID=192944 RepID=UPI0007BBA4E0|nr:MULTISPECIES: hypothetical protein [unclassified Rhodococcus (in: high G+C Gram-positive bacteria)]KZF01665.1 hypothetical protein A2J02_26860 [Rhodococcus sp. EPR-147]KZF02838.1 hypothetical protein A2J04_26970 [Rhodococcus sp. EPR-279]